MDSEYLAFAKKSAFEAARLAVAAALIFAQSGHAQTMESFGVGVASPREPLIVKQSEGVPRNAQAIEDPFSAHATEKDGQPLSGAVLQGPPAPLARSGKLPTIAWADAPSAVPSALETAINIVTRNYPSAKAARSALRAAAMDVRAADWLRFPSLSGNLAYLDQSLNPEPQLIVEQPLWAGGRIGAGIRRAKASEEVSSADYIETVQQLSLTTAQTYFEIARLTQRELLLRESLKEHIRLVETMERRVEQEVSPQADLELARSRAAQIEQDYTITHAQRETALRVLAELVSDPSFDIGPVPHYDIGLDLDYRGGLENEAVSYAPALRKLAAQAEVAKADLDARKASILPQVNLQYSYDDVFRSRVGVTIRAQATGGLSQLAEIDGARLRIQTTLEAQREAEQKLRRDIAADLIEFEAAKARASISTRASETASRVSESYTRQFIAGRRSWLDVMNALREAVNAQIGRTDAEISAQAAVVRLLLRSGRWRPNFRTSAQSVGEEAVNQDYVMGQM